MLTVRLKLLLYFKGMKYSGGKELAVCYMDASWRGRLLLGIFLPLLLVAFLPLAYGGSGILSNRESMPYDFANPISSLEAVCWDVPRTDTIPSDAAEKQDTLTADSAVRDTVGHKPVEAMQGSAAQDSLSDLQTSTSEIAGDKATLSYGTPQRYVLQEVKIEGVNYIEPEVLVALIGLNRGDTIEVPGSATTTAVKKLWQQNLFSHVEAHLDHVEGDLAILRFKVREQPRISQILYEGTKRADREDIGAKISLRVGQQATSSNLDAAKRVIVKHYHGKGYLNADVNVAQIPDTMTQNAVKVKFIVNRGKKVHVKSIDFEGNEAFTDKKLRKKGFKDTKIKNWNFFRSSKYIEEKYRADLGRLVDFYNKHGYRDAEVLSDTVIPVNPKRVAIKVQVKEGPQYHIRSVRWVGNTKYDAQALDKALGLKRGDVYDQELLNKRLSVDENSISTSYMDEGYLFFQVTPVELDVKNDSVTLEIRIFEGPQATISSVEISGNTKTSDRVVRRELHTLPGDLFSKSNIQRSFRELANLGYFNPETFNIVPVPNPADGTVMLKYELEEKSNDQVELSAGWGSGMFVGSLGLRLGNFSLRRMFQKDGWRPLPSGDGQSLSIRATTNGRQYRSISFSFVEPWLGGKKPNNFQLSVYHSVYDYSKFLWRPSDDYFKVTGGAVGLGTRLKWPDDYFTFLSEFLYQNYLLRNWKQEFLFTDGSANNLSLRFTLGRNSVDQLIYPRSGSNFSISLQLTPPYSLFNRKDYSSPSMTPREHYRWIEYHKWTARAQWYMQLVGDLVFYINAQFGVLGYYNRAYGYSPFEGFDLGGDGMSNQNFLYGRETIGLRGYANGSLTPVLANGVRMANIYDKFTMELRYPVVLQTQYAIYVLLFAEGGNAWYEINRFNPFQLHRSVGAGFRVFLPMVGMIGFDIGYGFDPVPGNPKANGWQPHIIIGMPF